MEVTPYVGVWIETKIRIGAELDIRSHPTWVCGLKLTKPLNTLADKMSHPTWVCGLKLVRGGRYLRKKESHPTWVCGLKLTF